VTDRRPAVLIAALLPLFLGLGAVLAAPHAAAGQDPAAPDPAAADSAWLAGETDRAEQLYGEILAADSSNHSALHRMALLRAWAERYDESLRLFDHLLALYPGSLDVRIDRARILAWRGDLESALAALDSVLAEDPGSTAALEALGQFHSWAGRYDEALDAYSRLARLDPGHETVPYERARVLAWASRFEAATAVYDSILAERPDDLDALAGRARSLQWAGRNEEATAAYRRVLEVEPGHLDALVGVARTLRWQGREALALEAARRAAELHPGSPEARSELRAARLPFAPLAAPSLAHESDSDGNRILTVAAAARFRPLAAVGTRVDAYVRTASEATAADLDHRAHGATVTGTWHTGAGWSASGTVGASANDVAPRPVPTYALALSSPGALPVTGSLVLRRQAFDATARLMERRVEMTELSASLRTRVAGSVALSAAAGSAWFLGRVSGQENRRWTAYLSASHRVIAPVTIGATARLFGYRHDLADGYFDPDFFGLAEILGRWQHSLGPVELSVEGAPGIQKVRSDGEPRPVGRAAASASWTIAPGRNLSLGALFANAGLDRLSAAEDADYSYRALTARLSWSF